MSNDLPMPCAVRKALLWGITRLKSDHAKASFEAELLLTEALAKTRAFLFAHPEYTLSVTEATLYAKFISQREQGRPIAYIIGKREFWSLLLKVNEHTLIPRHETELLVELALQLLPAQESLHLLDLGTGSGAIALAIASERPHWQLSACDKSNAALAIAQHNAVQLGLTNLTFYHSNWFDALPKQKYHAILANPPYIAPTDSHLNHGDVRFEPIEALISGQDGLADLECIINKSLNYLQPKGLLLLEHGYDQKEAVASILNRSQYHEIRCWQDLAGNDRVSGGRAIAT